MVGMALLVECTHAAAHCCSTLTQQIVYMITVQLQSKMYAGMNGWHGSVCNAHMQQRTVVLQHAADCVHDNCTATIKDTELNGGHGSAH
jgi:hypothetical protein